MVKKVGKIEKRKRQSKICKILIAASQRWKNYLNKEETNDIPVMRNGIFLPRKKLSQKLWYLLSKLDTVKRTRFPSSG